jgi:hypothetical protein
MHQLMLTLQLMSKKKKGKKRHWWESGAGLENGAVPGVLGSPGRRYYNEL